jgi:hypothetical protein
MIAVIIDGIDDTFDVDCYDGGLCRRSQQRYSAHSHYPYDYISHFPILSKEFSIYELHYCPVKK